MMLDQMNSLPIYIIVFAIIMFVAAFCAVFMVKSYRAGIDIGMDKGKLKKAIVSSASFTLIPSVMLILGVVALSGTLGIPLPWLRLSVIGSLQYETTTAGIAAEAVGMPGLSINAMTPVGYVSIALVMSLGIIWGALLAVLTLKKYLAKFAAKTKVDKTDDGKRGRNFADIAMTAMFIGICANYLASYTSRLVNRQELLPLAVMIMSGLAMALFTSLGKRKGFGWMEEFGLAGSMLASMAGAVVLNIMMGGGLV